MTIGIYAAVHHQQGLDLQFGIVGHVGVAIGQLEIDGRHRKRAGRCDMVMDDVQNALQRRMRIEARLRRLAQRSQGIGGDIARDHLVVVRMTLEQTLEIASAEIRLASGERPASRMHDERIVGEHVTPAGTRGTKAEVVLLAITRTERHVRSIRDGGRSRVPV